MCEFSSNKNDSNIIKYKHMIFNLKLLINIFIAIYTVNKMVSKPTLFTVFFTLKLAIDIIQDFTIS